MRLTTVERERITDSMLKIQSARANLEHVDGGKIPAADEIDSCLETANGNLKITLGYASHREPEEATKSTKDEISPNS